MNTKNNSNYRWGLELSIEFSGDSWWLCGTGEYPESSVLAGEYRFVKIEPYDTKEEAIACNPGTPIKEEASLPSWMFTRSMDIPFAGFDPADAGESWD